MPPRLPMPWALAPALWLEEVKGGSHFSSTLSLPCPDPVGLPWLGPYQPFPSSCIPFFQTTKCL